MALFELAIGYVLENEGGYVFDPADPGGETKYGISKRVYPNVDIKNLTVPQAQDIYRKDFWLFGGINDQRVATKVFDHYVNRKATIRQAQVAAGSTAVDGIYGGNTEHAINAMVPDVFLQNFVYGLTTLYQSIAATHPAEAKFLAGWLNRVRRLP